MVHMYLNEMNLYMCHTCSAKCDRY